jgi:hypothetical protein
MEMAMVVRPTIKKSRISGITFNRVSIQLAKPVSAPTTIKRKPLVDRSD